MIRDEYTLREINQALRRFIPEYGKAGRPGHAATYPGIKGYFSRTATNANLKRAKQEKA